jgi:uncharacterized repeat protein (TIGR03803 family)
MSSLWHASGCQILIHVMKPDVEPSAVAAVFRPWGAMSVTLESRGTADYDMQTRLGDHLPWLLAITRTSAERRIISTSGRNRRDAPFVQGAGRPTDGAHKGRIMMPRVRYPLRKPALACTVALSLFALAGSAQAQSFKLRLEFKGSDGGRPMTPLLRDSAGNLYGTTYLGGTEKKDGGVAFKLAPDGTVTVLHKFVGGKDGYDPSSGLIADSRGNLYGLTIAGGDGDKPFGLGTVFKLASDGTESILYAFKGGTNDGSNPVGSLLADSQGNFYGTTMQGGANDQGSVFELAADGTESVLYSFQNGSDGAEPVGGVIADSQGNLYGTTFTGGLGTGGTVFKLAPNGTETILYSFDPGNSYGSNPNAGLIIDKNGNLFGTTANGGNAGSCLVGCGTIFEIASDGSFTVLYRFTGGSDGGNPYAPLLEDKKGNFYGTTVSGGTCGGYGCGVVFELSSGGTETPLYSFTGKDDGDGPGAAVIADKHGNLFGTAEEGGQTCPNYIFQTGCGTVFEIKR